MIQTDRYPITKTVTAEKSADKARQTTLGDARRAVHANRTFFLARCRLEMGYTDEKLGEQEVLF